MYRYETHLHTSPVSRCASASVRETVEFYKKMDYDGIFITNHFLDANINIDRELDYETKIHFYFSDYEEAVQIGRDIGLKVFLGVELSYGGSDFLVYGLDKAWYLAHPEIMDMKKSDELRYLMESGGYIVHAHPFREAGYIDHIRLYPRHVNAIETLNITKSTFINDMAKLYAEHYNLPQTAGTDNHTAGRQKILAGVMTDTPLQSERDYIDRLQNRELTMFTLENPG